MKKFKNVFKTLYYIMFYLFLWIFYPNIFKDVDDLNNYEY